MVNYDICSDLHRSLHTHALRASCGPHCRDISVPHSRLRLRDLGGLNAAQPSIGSIGFRVHKLKISHDNYS